MSKIIIFTDGSSRGNPGPGGWGAIVCVKGEKITNVFELGNGEKKTTNNRMELAAAIGAFEELKNRRIDGEIIFYSDSTYVIKGISVWVFGWQQNGWKTKDNKEVSNKDLWQKLVEAAGGFDVSWKVVEGHVGVAGNERCDEIATAFADRKNPKLFDGALKDYSVLIFDLKVNSAKAEIKDGLKNRAKGGKAYSYVSLVNGEIGLHKTWTECEEKVKGKNNVRFKKALSREDEEQITNDFLRKK